MAIIPRQRPHHWGTYPTDAQLPNVSGSPNTTPNLQVGDIAFSQQQNSLVVCQSASIGSASWIAVGSGSGGGGVVPITGATNENVSVASEVQIGGFSFDGSAVTSGVTFETIGMLTLPSGTGWGEVRLYDMGPLLGPPTSGTLVSTHQFSAAGGPGAIQTYLTVSAAPTFPGQIYNSPRIYELRALLAGGATPGTDSITVVWSGFKS